MEHFDSLTMKRVVLYSKVITNCDETLKALE